MLASELLALELHRFIRSGVAHYKWIIMTYSLSPQVYAGSGLLFHPLCARFRTPTTALGDDEAASTALAGRAARCVGSSCLPLNQTRRPLSYHVHIL